MPVVLKLLQWSIFPVYLIGCTSKRQSGAGDISGTGVAKRVSVRWPSVQRVIEEDADQQLSMLKEAGLSQTSLGMTQESSLLKKKNK